MADPKPKQDIKPEETNRMPLSLHLPASQIHHNLQNPTKYLDLEANFLSGFHLSTGCSAAIISHGLRIANDRAKKEIEAPDNILPLIFQLQLTGIDGLAEESRALHEMVTAIDEDPEERIEKMSMILMKIKDFMMTENPKIDSSLREVDAHPGGRVVIRNTLLKSATTFFKNKLGNGRSHGLGRSKHKKTLIFNYLKIDLYVQQTYISSIIRMGLLISMFISFLISHVVIHYRNLSIVKVVNLKVNYGRIIIHNTPANNSNLLPTARSSEYQLSKRNIMKLLSQG
ncbi:hypothetical protein RND71_019562 [Anisodus tanguticus]|uniref:Uncharacterized protein n=1 Tax=Anisodus tanguticus TaxID=243964 RepID=A0AAE1VHJ5_9SOLA|nr:hypothetical protein RND71_019562 [Anisodus tanguticus]